MKRSEINQIIRTMEQVIAVNGAHLPAFASWTEAEWQVAGSEADEIRDNALGWDITDYGLGRFYEWGLALFTLRNGNVRMAERYPKPYAEKFLMMFPGQQMCFHYHWSKMEDIINRGGNDLVVQVYNGAPDRSRLDTPVSVSIDGVRRTVPAGTELTLHPGESLTVTPYLYHLFRVPAGGDPLLIGEVSMCNDDEHDNCFLDDCIGRFPAIEEDAAPYRLLCTEYPRASS